jgi:ribosome-binding ATPase
MEISIIGLSNSGKTTIFNALTKNKVESRSSSAIAPNVGSAKVPEPRLKLFEEVYHPKRIVMVDVKYVDIAVTAKPDDKKEGIFGAYLKYLSNADALMHVVRMFNNDNVPHPAGSIDPKRDMANMDLELAFSDLVIIERRLTRVTDSMKGAKSNERDSLLKEQSLLEKIKNDLEKEIPIWKQNLTNEEKKIIANYQFLSAKPMLVIVNIDENQLPEAAKIESELRQMYAFEQFDVIALCGKLEMELSQLSDQDAADFRSSMGLQQSALDRVISASYRLLGLMSFFTASSTEVRVWTIPAGTTAVRAAGKIHSDIEKGFIRAETFSFSDLEKYRSEAEIKRHGLFRLEGKNYIMKDGDVVEFLFNV